MPEASVNFGTGVSNAWSNVATFVPKFAVFLLILIVGYLIAKAIAKILSKVLTARRLRPAGRARRRQAGTGPLLLRRGRHPGQDRLLRDHAVRAVHRVRRVRQ